MPVDIIQPQSHLALEYDVPRRRTVEFEVSANLPVSTYVLDEDGYDAFQQGESIPSYGGFTDRREHHQELILPFRGRWVLLIVNKLNEDVAVSYDVYW